MMNETFAERKIENIARQHGLSEQGKIWMENCLDPFPDVPRKSDGYPDTCCGPSITQKLKMAYTLKATNVSLNSPWDALIMTTEIENIVPLATYTSTGDVQTPSLDFGTQAASAITYGGLQIYAGNAGVTLTLSGNPVASLGPAATYFADGRTRVIAKGFEVTNTTPELYRGGAVTVFRDPQIPDSEHNLNVYGRGTYMTSGGFVTGITFPVTTCFESVSAAGPVSFNSCQQLDGTKTWGADMGCYCVATMGTPENEPIEQERTRLMSTYDGATPTTWFTQPLDQVGVTNFKLPTGTGAYPSVFNRSGAYFTGLDYHSTLQIVYHVIVERFVNENALDLVVMTTKSSSYDPEALELYSRAATYLPAGVPVGENADGDWIKNVAGVLGDLGVPGMGFVKAGVDLYNNMYSKKPKNNKKVQDLKQTEKKVNKIANQERKLIKEEVRLNNVPKMPPVPQIPKGQGKRKPRKRKPRQTRK